MLSNHQKNECKRSYIWTIAGCGARHSKLFHIDENDDEKHVTLSNACSDVPYASGVPFVEVNFGHISSFAVHDTGSDDSFFLSLGLKGELFSFSPSTLQVNLEMR